MTQRHTPAAGDSAYQDRCHASRRMRVLTAVAVLGSMPMLAAGTGIPSASDDVSTLLQRCAASVHPVTMAAVISAESSGHQFAIADAGPVKLPWSQRKHLVRSYFESSIDTATARAKDLIANGHTVSLGLAQINDRNLSALGLSLRDVFDPCTNVAAGAKILTRFYVKAVATFGTGERALHAALSAYNSGDWLRGANDGYVATVYRRAGKTLALHSTAVVPRISAVSAGPSREESSRQASERSFTMGGADYPSAQ